jgi:hypothetical protein
VKKASSLTKRGAIVNALRLSAKMAIFSSRLLANAFAHLKTAAKLSFARMVHTESLSTRTVNCSHFGTRIAASALAFLLSAEQGFSGQKISVTASRNLKTAYMATTGTLTRKSVF